MKKYGLDAVPGIVNRVKRFGFEYATIGGVTWSFGDIKVPEGKTPVIDEARKKVEEMENDYKNGLLSEDEKRRMVIETWHGAKTAVEKLVEKNLDPKSPVSDIITSGARGSIGNLTQMVGMKGLIQNTAGETIELPIISSMLEGLNPVEYFMSTHGSRKGLTDTALGTARAGYLTRRLFDVAQDSIITETDCKAKRGITIGRVSASGVKIDFAEAIRGRTLAAEVEGFKKNHYVEAEDAAKIAASDAKEVVVRSPMSCETRYGICAACYGMDLTTQEMVDLGEAVGTVAAQAIGEPGTQLTMRTFHAGGTASVGGDITSGLPRVEEVFEKRSPKNPAVVSKTDGVVIEIKDSGRDKVLVVAPDAGSDTKKRRGKKEGDAYEYLAPYPRMALVKTGDSVKKGQLLTDGSADLDELFEYAGRAMVQEYIIAETSKIYELQGASVSRKHLEVIVKQMFSRSKVTETGDSDYSVGDVMEQWEHEEEVKQMEAEGKIPPKAREMVLGIKESALSRRSFLSAASFEQTTKILINAALKGSVDTLRGLKENVILGRLIPAGTGFPGSKKREAIDKLQAKRAMEFASRMEESQLTENIK
jgi:DNA-directed RNA polymerase subunit beta'